MPALMKRPSAMCSGPNCPGCSSPECMAEGGSVTSGTKRSDFEKGVHQPTSKFNPGQSLPGLMVRAGNHGHFDTTKEEGEDSAKLKHRKMLGEMRSMKKPNLYAQGGEVKGHGKLGVEFDSKAKPREGYPKSAAEQEERLKAEHARVSEMQRRKPEPEKYAEGGEVGQHGEDEELHHAIGSELMDALERKDKKGIMDALNAAVMDCMNGREK